MLVADIIFCQIWLLVSNCDSYTLVIQISETKSEIIRLRLSQFPSIVRYEQRHNQQHCCPEPWAGACSLAVTAHWGRRSGVLRRRGQDQYPNLECRRAAGHSWPGLLISRAWSANSNVLEVTRGLRADGRHRENTRTRTCSADSNPTAQRR